MKSSASIAGHPLHPILVAFPIGLWTFAFVCDLAFACFPSHYAWKEAALFCIGGGLIGALVAAVPGFVDYAGITGKGRLKKIAIYHLVLNLTGFAIFGWSFSLRWADLAGHLARPLPVVLAAGGVLLITVAGWYGGEMVYKHRMAVSEPDKE
ncbi:Uncharacterized membrane protein [Verrucomicrobium sp. GAS474]|uniref:DUF2231 domain-containing protein n=1 Tax=Verrucomicrobium sp. GAS474 TaxID=1882831 RepID=UPI00087D1ADA|nr:DUF2231 domain-containing protein [Verrucomicrobium sp. GAS474]SDU11991.1 Uncharacterized membrane protein [Verrucomicrobium sp. GAS474]